MKSMRLPILSIVCLSFLVAQFSFCSKAMAADDGIPLYIKYRYEKKTGRKWYDASRERQKAFIEEQRSMKLIEKSKQSRRDQKMKIREFQKAQKKNFKKQKEVQREIARQQRKADKARLKAQQKMKLIQKKQAMERRMDMLKMRQQTRRR